MRILLIEDDQKLNHSLKYQLEKENFTVDTCFDGEEALYYINQNIHDCILLDRMIPSIDGTQLLNIMRSQNNSTPVILITALGALNDKITGLDAGADDYLVKPFDFGELLARIRCVTRRPPLVHENDILTFKDLTLHVTGSRLNGPAGECSLSKKENELFQFFIRNTGQTLTREQLLTKIWGLDADIENGNLDNYIHFLRRRLNAVGSHVAIRTVRGIGYRFCPPEES